VKAATSYTIFYSISKLPRDRLKKLASLILKTLLLIFSSALSTNPTSKRTVSRQLSIWIRGAIKIK
jgi:hypothetical protein